MSTDQTATARTPGGRRSPKSAPARWVAVAAAAVVVVIGGLVAVNLGDDDGGTVAAGPALELDLGENNITASCLAPTAEILADMSPAFAATVATIDDEQVTLDVTKWFAGGEAETVELHATAGMAALIAGFEFEVGGEYLITATDGTVNYCGYSGPATPELTTMFDEAFPS